MAGNTPEAQRGTGGPILGRALVGHFGAPVLIETEDGNWGSAFVRPVPRAEAVEMFAAREVLLVSPAAGKVLELVGPAVHRWRHGMPNDLYDDGDEQPGDVEEALAEAWDAMVGDNP